MRQRDRESIKGKGRKVSWGVNKEQTERESAVRGYTVLQYVERHLSSQLI